MAKSSSGFDFGTVFELVGVVLNSTKNKVPGKNGKGGVALDPQKLALGLSGIVGQQLLRWWGRRRELKKMSKQLASGQLSLEDIKSGFRPKKRGGFGPVLLLGAIVGGAIYLLTMNDEQRQAFFRQLDELAGQVISFVNELQGKPYSQDYEEGQGAGAS